MDRRGLAQARRRSAMSTPAAASEGRRRSLLRPYGGARVRRRRRGRRSAAAGFYGRGRQRGRAGRRHAAPRCALRPSLPSSFHCSSSGVHLPRPAARSRPFDPAAVWVDPAPARVRVVFADGAQVRAREGRGVATRSSSSLAPSWAMPGLPLHPRQTQQAVRIRAAAWKSRPSVPLGNARCGRGCSQG
jgi:hypothetical protein